LNPNFSPYAYGVRAGATIIDLDHTVPLLRRAAQLVRAVAFVGGQILFIGTRPDLRQVVKTSATRLGKQGYYISDRWIPGTLTNTSELYSPEIAAETLAVPDLVVFLNPLANLTAIRECALSHVPTIGIIDSDADPRIVMYPIPANDESTQTAELIAGILSIAGREGLALRLEEEAMAEEVQLKRDDDDFWNELEAMHKDAQRGNEKITDGKIVDGADLQVKVGDYDTLDIVEEAAADAEELAEELEEELGYNFMEEESDEEGDDDTTQKEPTEGGQHFDH
jgi:small subunit ribosomal protein S2